MINNENLSEVDKSNASAQMLSLVDASEKEVAAELMLEAKGFVAFKTDAKDKRKQRIVLTKKCMNFCAKNDDVGKDVMEKMFAGIPEKDINKTIQTIMKIESNMKEEK